MKFFEKIEKIFGKKEKKIDLTNRNDYAINCMDNIVYLHDKKSKPYMNVLMRDLQKNLNDITKDIQKTIISFEDKKKSIKEKKMSTVKKSVITLEEFQEISNEIRELDKLYINDYLEYTKRLLGEERVKEILKKRKINNKVDNNDHPSSPR